MMKRAQTFIAALLFAAFAGAVPADKTPFTVIQPDGSKLTLVLRGDEHSHWHSTIDGLPVKEDGNGSYRYIIMYSGNEPVLSSIQARNPQSRSDGERAFVEELRSSGIATQAAARQKARRNESLAGKSVSKIPAFPNKGEVKGLVILVEFKDRKFEAGNDNARFDKMLNEENYEGESYGSAYDYFNAQSHGQFQPHFDVYGPVTLSNGYSFYGRNDAWSGDDMNADLMVNEACMLLDDEVDFSQYDLNDDGVIDLVFIMYAGYGENSGADSGTIWPHASDLRYYFDNPVMRDGKIVGPYACSCELRGNEQTSPVSTAGIGVFCHEFSHCLGLMDLYDTNGSTGGSGRGYGSYSVMDVGCYNNSGYTPCSYTAYERMVIGWLDPTELGDEYHENLTLTDINVKNEAYAIYNPNNRDEFFVLENRQQTGWDSALPASGMLISHIDYDAEDWEANVINSYYEDEGAIIVPANNSYSSLTDEHQLYPTADNNSFTDQSVPAAQFKDGTYTNRPVTNIREAGGVVYFTYNELSLAKPVALPATDVTGDAFTANWERVTNAESYVLTVTDEGVNPNPGAVIFEDFSKFTGGSEDSPSNSDVSSRLDDYMGEAGWRGSKVYQAGGKCKLGTSSATGYLVSPELTLPKDFAISVEARAYVTASGNADKSTLYIGVGEKTETGEGGEWLAYEEFPLTADVEVCTLHYNDGGRPLCFEIGTLSKRAIIDNISAGSSAARAPLAETSQVYTDIFDNYYRVTGLDKSHDYAYTVKAVAGGIESEASDAVTVNMSLSVNSEEVEVMVKVTEGQLQICPSMGCVAVVSTIDGLCIYNRRIDGDVSIPLEKGIYVVTLNGKSMKVKI